MPIEFLFYLLLLLLTSINGLINYKTLTAPFKALVFLFILTFISEVISRVLAITIRNSSPIYHIFCLVEFAAFSRIFYSLATSRQWKQTILIALILYTILSVANSLFVQPINTFPSNSILVMYLVRIVCSIVQFNLMLEKPSTQDIYKQSTFWMNSAVLAFSVAMPVNFGAHNYFIRHHITTVPLSSVVYVLGMLYYLALGYSIVLDSRARSL